MKKEYWRPIVGYEGLYEVSSLGRVKSLNYERTGKEKIMKLQKQNCGYICVYLSKNKEHKNLLVHRLVAKAFIQNPNNLPCVNHKDEDKTNNCVDNLEWCDYAYNSNYGTKNKRMFNNRTKKPVVQIFNGKVIKVYNYLIEVEKDGFSKGNVCACCKGMIKQYKGYNWRYATPDEISEINKKKVS